VTSRARFALLAKELGELAAQRRTYWLRVLVGLLVLAVFWWSHAAAAKRATGPFGMLGQGDAIFAPVAWWLLAATLLGIPLVGAGSIARERETGSLELLLASPIGPGSILLQKFLSRLALPLSAVAIALPLLAAATAMGGVPIEGLVLVSVLLASSILTVAALTLAMSAMCRTAGTALIATFALVGAAWMADRTFFGAGGGSAFQPRALILVLERVDTSLDRARTAQSVWMGGPSSSRARSVFASLSTHLVDPSARHVLSNAGVWTFLTALELWILFAFARRQLVREDLMRGATWLTRLARRCEARIREANRSVGGYEIVAWGRGTPGDQPVTWRERPSTTARIRLVVLGQVLALLVAAPVVATNRWLDSAIPIAWSAALLVLGISGARALARERGSGTLPLLVSSPLSGASILAQKAQAQRSWIAIVGITMATLVGINAAVGATSSPLHGSASRYGIVFVAGAATAVLHACLAVRLGMLLALWIRGHWLYPAVIGGWVVMLSAPAYVVAIATDVASTLVSKGSRYVLAEVASLAHPATVPLYLTPRSIPESWHYTMRDLLVPVVITQALLAFLALAAVAALSRASAERGLADSIR